MRLSVGVVLCLFLALLGVGCRKALAPNIDRNQAPETWITAAPQDTITLRDPQGRPIFPEIGRIPVRFHVYWAGSDRDGAVAGFYFAVVETLPVPPEGLPLPTLPGPKARDYRFTTKSDSVFIFTTSEQVAERQHAFFIYAVDNDGKPDPTPARFIFNALDRFPPLAVFDLALARGKTYRLLPGGGVQAQVDDYLIRDSLNIATQPSDTVPSNSLLTFRWHGEPTIAGTYVAGYRYKLDEPNFNSVDSSVHMVQYNTGVGNDHVSPGLKVFTLRAVGQSGWRGESTRRFQMNFSPDTWYAGPDRNSALAGWTISPDGRDRYLEFPNWDTFTGIPGTTFGPDSVNVLPAQRVERKTFFEIYRDRVYARAENDTIHQNSWVVLVNGGLDVDSPYNVQVNNNDPALPPSGIVVRPDTANGSPIGFRSRIVTVSEPFQSQISPSESGLYPIYDAARFDRAPYIAAYWGMRSAGKAYALVRAEDGNLERDKRIPEKIGLTAVQLADGIDDGSITDPYLVSLRSKVLTFYVDKAPELLRNPPFIPQVNQTFTGTSWTLNLIADDIDPFDPGNPPSRIGGPSATKVLRRRITVLGKDVNGRDTIYVDPTDYFNANMTILVPTYIVPGQPTTLRIQLCDCPQCESIPGQGRCRSVNIPVNYTGPQPVPSDPPTPSTQRPGSTQASRRSP